MAFSIVQRLLIPGVNRILPAPCVVLRADLGALAEWPTERLGPAYRERVMALLSALPGQLQPIPWFVPSLEDLLGSPGYTLAHLLERMALHLQRLAGEDVSAGDTKKEGSAGSFRVAYECADFAAGSAAWRVGLNLLLGALPDEPRHRLNLPRDFDPLANAKRHLAWASGRAPSITTSGNLVRAAGELGIPVIRRHGNPAMFQVGHGVHRRFVQHAFTDRTGFISWRLAEDKVRAATLLRESGIPVPAQFVVNSADQAERAAARLRFPVVVKPVAGEKGIGVFTHLTTTEQVRKAWAEAARHGSGVLVEKHVEGNDYRLLVVEGRLIAAAQRVRGHVVGDGAHTVRELIEIENRGRGIRGDHRTLLVKLALDDEAAELLRGQSLTAESIPEAGQTVWLRGAANVARGGTPRDVTETVHPENKAMAERTARILGIDLCGVDLLAPDISRPVSEVGGAICEVNCTPGLRAHMIADPERSMAREIVQSMFPNGGRIPTAAVAGTNGKTTTCHMLAHILRQTGRSTGLATTQGVWIGETQIMTGDLANFYGARAIFADPSAEAAVVELARKGIIYYGIPFTNCDVAALLNVEDDHLGVDGIATIEELAALKALVIASADKAVVLNADHPLVMAQRPVCKAETLILVADSPRSPNVARHLTEGGTAVSLAKNKGKETITVFAGRAKPRAVVDVAAIPATKSGRLRFNITNAMFATALALGMDIPANTIGKALRSFDTVYALNPGRFNVFDGLPFTVVMDYAHNPHGVAALCKSVETMKTKGRKIICIANVGCRHLSHVDPAAERLARAFDVFVCSRTKSRCDRNLELKGKPADEVPRRIADALRRYGVGGDRIEAVADEREAIDRTLRIARPGDFVLVNTTDEFEFVAGRIKELRSS